MAKPTPLPIGRANPHVMQSRGADPYIMNFYSTSYSTGFTKPNIEFAKGKRVDIPAYSGKEVFKPRSAPENKKTGYVANVRPQIYYQPSLDEYDNPDMGKMLSDNYNTMTHLQFQPFKLNDGTEELPVQVQDQRTAFTQTAYNHNPLPKDVANNFIDSRIKAPYDVLQKHRALLNKINDHNPITNENYGYGPNYMSTEYATRYETPDRTKNGKLKTAVGPKETSGFTSNKEKEDVLTETPGERWLYNNRHTGNSDYKDKFVPYVYPQINAENIFLPNVSNIDNTHESNYTKSFKPSDLYPKKHHFDSVSEAKDKFLNQQPLNQYLDEKLGSSKIVGPKEIGGQSHSEKGFLSQLDDPRRFITNYQIKHYDMTPKFKDREGFVTGGVNGNFDDGYVVNNKAQRPGIINTTYELKQMDPYQSRIIRANDKFYDDHTHDNKLFQRNKVVTFADNNPYSIKTSS